MSIEQAWEQALTGGNSYFLGHSAINSVHVSEKCEFCIGIRHLLKVAINQACDTGRRAEMIEQIDYLGREEPPR